MSTSTTGDVPDDAAQAQWRQYPAMLDELAMQLASHSFENLSVLDLGCGIGYSTRLFAQRGAHVVGVDTNSELLDRARVDLPQIRFELAQTIFDGSVWAPSRPVDIVWSAFSLAYSDNIHSTIREWYAFSPRSGANGRTFRASYLKPGGLLAICEINGLFTPHSPLEHADFFAKFETECLGARYNSYAGGAMVAAARQCDLLTRVKVSDYSDAELAQEGSGPVSKDVLVGWSARFARLSSMLRDFDSSVDAQDAFFKCLTSPDHVCSSKIRLLIAQRRQVDEDSPTLSRLKTSDYDSED